MKNFSDKSLLSDIPQARVFFGLGKDLLNHFI